jgi:5-amino-6-(5-phosphoribosylamino)uracil reductase
VSPRPYILLSVAASLDGYIDRTDAGRLLLSNDQDFDRVDEVRAGVDAILVGANTICTDNPGLAVRSAQRREKRVADGLPPTPARVTLTASGDLDPAARFFAAGEDAKLVYTATSGFGVAENRVGAVASVIDAGDPLDLNTVLADLVERKVERLMVEGGGVVHTLFLTSGVVDELHVVIAPIFVGQAGAPRFVNPGVFPQSADHRMTLAETRQMGDVVLLRYLLPDADRS